MAFPNFRNSALHKICFENPIGTVIALPWIPLSAPSPEIRIKEIIEKFITSTDLATGAEGCLKLDMYIKNWFLPRANQSFSLPTLCGRKVVFEITAQQVVALGTLTLEKSLSRLKSLFSSSRKNELTNVKIDNLIKATCVETVTESADEYLVDNGSGIVNEREAMRPYWDRAFQATPEAKLSENTFEFNHSPEKFVRSPIGRACIVTSLNQLENDISKGRYAESTPGELNLQQTFHQFRQYGGRFPRGNTKRAGNSHHKTTCWNGFSVYLTRNLFDEGCLTDDIFTYLVEAEIYAKASIDKLLVMKIIDQHHVEIFQRNIKPRRSIEKNAGNRVPFFDSEE